MAKKKRRGLNLVALLLVLAVLIGAYVAYDQYEGKKAKEKDAQDDSIQVIKMEEADLTSIAYKNEKADLKLIKNADAAWVNEANQEMPLNSTYTNKMASTAASVTATKVIAEKADDLSEFGLTEPTLTVTAEKKDGSQVKLLVGSKSPLGDGYYACLDGENKVYLVGTFVVSAFDYEESALATVASAPTITAANITHLLVNDKDSGTLEIDYEEKNSYDASDSGLSPYILKQGFDYPISGDSTNITTYFGNFASLRYSKCVDYSGNDLEKYGLDQPKTTISIDYFADEKAEDSKAADTAQGDDAAKTQETVRKNYTYNLQIGSLNKEDSVYYVKDASANSVYTMGQDMVEKMLTYNTFELVSKYAQLIGVKSVDEVSCTFGQETYKLNVTHTKSTDADGKEKETESFTLDGKEYNEDDARKLYQSMICPMYDALIPDGYTDTEKPVIARFVFKRTAGSDRDDLITEYKEYDDSFYTITVNGTERFLVDKRDVEKAAADIKAAVSK